MHAVDGVSLGVEAGRDARHRRRVRLGQERLDADGDGPHAGARTPTISGTARFEGRDLLTLPNEELRRIRGNDIAMIFQDPLSSLHPFYKVGAQLVEAIRDAPGRLEGAGARARRSSCSSWSASRTREGASTPTRTSSPAACASAR